MIKINDVHMEKLKKLKEEDRVCYFSGSNLSVLFETKILDVSYKVLRLQNNVPITMIKDLINSKQFIIKSSDLSIESKNIFPYADTLSFEEIQVKTLEDQRENERYYYSNKENIYFKILNPIDKTTIIKKPIIEMSDGGFSIKSKIDSKLFTPGRKFNNCEFYKDNKKIKTRNLEIIYAQRFYSKINKKYLQVGFKFIDFEERV
ncbi:MAG: hypothetical protein CMP11_04235 [Zetaproteobacteria bacterium]|nr:hypothetical protein [Pseudobdellovibrionaceae bacterium]|tara:strand:- start:17 stop:628 length:612 start_codon:yes stop_codon:yes gene_type:complete